MIQKLAKICIREKKYMVKCEILYAFNAFPVSFCMDLFCYSSLFNLRGMAAASRLILHYVLLHLIIYNSVAVSSHCIIGRM